MNNESLIQFMLGILNIIGYQGDRDAHAVELAEAYDKMMATRMMEASREFFEEYFRDVAPMLSDDQKAELSNYFEQQSAPEATT